MCETELEILDKLVKDYNPLTVDEIDNYFNLFSVGIFPSDYGEHINIPDNE